MLRVPLLLLALTGARRLLFSSFILEANKSFRIFNITKMAANISQRAVFNRQNWVFKGFFRNTILRSKSNYETQRTGSNNNGLILYNRTGQITGAIGTWGGLKMAGMEKNCNIDKWYQKSWFEILERYPTKRQEHIRKGWWSIVARIETVYCNMVKNIQSDTIRSFRSHIREIFHVVTHKRVALGKMFKFVSINRTNPHW